MGSRIRSQQEEIIADKSYNSTGTGLLPYRCTIPIFVGGGLCPERKIGHRKKNRIEKTNNILCTVLFVLTLNMTHRTAK